MEKSRKDMKTLKKRRDLFIFYTDKNKKPNKQPNKNQ